MSLPVEIKRISLLIRRFCTDHVLERKKLENGVIYDEYRKSWLEILGNPRSGEVISTHPDWNIVFHYIIDARTFSITNGLKDHDTESMARALQHKKEGICGRYLHWLQVRVRPAAPTTLFL